MENILKYDYNTFPKSLANPDGMIIIEGDVLNIRGKICKEDIIYQNKNGTDLKIRLLYPDFFRENKRYPLVVHIQGSAWFQQNLNDHILDLKDIITKGYIIAIVEYLPLPDAIFPSQVEDAKIAMNYLISHADELFIDKNNLFLSGDSSGGHTALMCWASESVSIPGESIKEFPKIKACIDLYGIVDLETLSVGESAHIHDRIDGPATLLLGGIELSKNQDMLKKSSVLTYLSEETPTAPLLIMHGNKDTVIPFEQSVQLYEHCKKLRKDVRFYCVDDADHGGNVFYCKNVLNIITAFLEEHTD